MKKIYLFLLLSFLSFAGYAQTAASYAFSRSTGTYSTIVGGSGTVSISSGGIISDDGINTGIPIGFTFTYCGTNYTTLSVNANGWISLAGSTLSGFPSYNNTSGSLSSIASGVGLLMGFWDDLYGTSKVAYYQTSGSTGSRVFTFEYVSWSTCCGTGNANINFQIKLYEGVNRVEYRYQTSTGGVPTAATIGICNSTTDFQTLPSTTSTTCNTTFNSSTSLPAAGSVLSWCPPSPITGNSGPFCFGTTLSLGTSISGGTWSSASTSVATINSSGVVTGASSTGGTSVISYTTPCGAVATTTVTVLAAPGATTGGGSPIYVCGTQSLTNSSGSGTWSSSNTAVGTVTSSGVVTGTGAGTANITFTLAASGCFTTTPITVNALPAITGPGTVCTGQTITLANSVSGGSWSSSNSGQASVSGLGVVTGNATGTPTITYTVSGGCFVTTQITVNQTPAGITGFNTVCGGTAPTTTSLGNTTSGGTWSSSNPAFATVGSSSGVVTGVAAGTPVISYTMPTGCFSTLPMTVNAVAAITGTPSACLGSTTTLSNSTSGGTWSSSNTSVATINSSGVVTGVSLGTSIVSYTVASMGCAAVITVNVTNAPSTYTITGGGAYCAGGTGVHIGLNNSNVGISYYLYNGATPVDIETGTGGAIDFGLFTASGTYTVVANPGTACSANMLGSVTVSVDPLPTAFSVGGGGAYCAGGSGVNITLSSSTIGVNYQLMLGSTPIGSHQVGTSGTLTFGPVTTAGTYTIVATNASTFCVNNMSGSATVSINALPTSFSVTGGGSFCLGGSGVNIGLSGSSTGTTYVLRLSGSAVATLSGTGSALNFGLITVGGPYTVTAENTATGCTNTMSGTVTVTIDPLPTVYTVTGGGSFCLGGTGVAVGLNSSAMGINYQLFLGSSSVGSPVAGTGAAISFGLQTTPGSYTVVATNTTTGCINNMFGSVSISINPLPTVFSVTGGGGYCAGGTGRVVGLSGSVSGNTYQLYNGTTLVGAASGTGSPISFGLQLGAGTYTVTGTTTATTCSGNMSGSVTITINPLPIVYTVTGGGNYCSGTTGVTVGLGGSTIGVNYQLFTGTTASGSAVAGTGAAISFGAQTTAGAYTVVATDAITGCTRNMSGSAVVIVNPLPTVYAVTGGGGYCSGGAGMHVGLAASNIGISYEVFEGVTSMGVMTGTGAALDFGFMTNAGTYTVVATNTTTGCTRGMSGSATVIINALPAAYSVNGGGNYCAGGTGVSVGLGLSDAGVNYQLYNGLTPVGAPVAGTGSPISFGMQTMAGTYTVMATVAGTGCSNVMTGSVNVAIDPLPTVYTITGGGNYCAGGTGVHVGLSFSAAGIDYTLMNGVAVVATMPGTGTAIDFGFQTGAGTYTVVATNPATLCTNNMTGSVTIAINPLPALHSITGGGNYCAGGTGVAIGLGGSTIGTSYQLLNGSTPSGAPMTGTGLPLNFGLKTLAGTYTIVGSIMGTGCAATMTGSTSIIVNPLPAVNTVTGGGNYCVGGSGVSIGVDGSVTGVNYQLYNGSTPVGAAVPGSTGLPIDFGPQTTLGVYTVVAVNTATTCMSNMLGSATIGIYPLPVVYNVTGGGNYCNGGAGVPVGLSGSNTGVTYQLYNFAAPVGGPVAGTGLALNFGVQTGAGPYTVVATTVATGCENDMNGSAIVNVVSLPTAHNVTGGGNYCAGGAGVVIGLDGSDMSTTYRLHIGAAPVGSLVAGTGGPISFGMQTAAGSYTVIATNTSSTCVNTMTGGATISIDALPGAYTLSGGGNYCSGGAGLNILLSGSDVGTDYQLFNGTTMVGAAMPGTGSGLDFGPQTAAGTYMVVATDGTTTCSNNMSGTVTISINPLPTTYIVGGGGNYCAGGAGVNITLSGSNMGITYQLMNGIDPVDAPIAGTGMGLNFGMQTGGGTYTVVATNSTTLCTNTMTGSATIVVNPLPIIYPVSSTSSTYCAGAGGVNIWLNSSETGVAYQLYNGSTTVGSPLAGTGATLNFGFLFAPGSYSIKGVNTTTGCTSTMSSGVTIVVNPLPTVYTITGGGSYCAGSAGVNIGLSSSNSGISYQLWMGGTLPVGSPVPGTGGAITFGTHTATGNYTVVATNTATTCTNSMSGTATVAVNSIPSVFAVTGGGSYCAGGTGVNVMLSGSALGMNYQLMRNSTTVVGAPVAGTGTSLNFGPQTASGFYSVVATDAMTGCTNDMSGTVSVSINPAPNAFSVTGGGGYCPGGTGVLVGTSGSNTGIDYQLMNGITAVGSPVPGTGTGINFGLQTAAGTYSVMATNTTTGCTGYMSGSVVVAINPLPAVYPVVGGGDYCAGGAGVHVGLGNSTTGINYTLYASFSAVVTLPGTGGPLDFGVMTTAGTYTVIATNIATGCSENMSGSVTITVNPIVVPMVTIMSSGGDTVCEGSFVTFSATTLNGGGSPAYQWTVNGIPSATGSSYSFAPSNGDVVVVRMTSSATCATPAMVVNSKTMTVLPNQLPVVSVTANPGTNVCQGTTVTYTAAPTFGGNSPSYTWFVNSMNSGTAATLSYIPVDGDVVYAQMTSNYQCRTATTATSSSMIMEVDIPALPVVAIIANPGLNLASGQTVTFSTTVLNGGPAPSYQWMINGVAIPGANHPTFVSSTLNNNDSVTCQVLSSGGCPGLLGFNSVIVRVVGVGVNQVASASDVRLVPNPSKGTFTVKGTLGTATDEEISLEVTNMLGQTIYTSKVTVRNGEVNEMIQLSNNVANGMYILNLRTATGNKVFHLVIEQ